MLAIPRGYVLSATPPDVPAGHSLRSLHGLHLVTGPEMPVHELHDLRGGVVGWLLGWPISGDGSLVGEAFPIETADAEEHLYELGGAWMAILTAARRLYLDVAGTIGLTYSRELRRAAPSSAWMPEAQVNPDLAAAMDIPAGFRNWYPFGLTPRIGVQRLLPNHYLDLGTWLAIRHWPQERLPDTAPGDAVRIVGEHTERAITALAPLRPYMSLTAGRDTRSLLACSRGVADGVEFFTIASPSSQARLDADVATRLAERLRLRHSVLPWEKATADELEEWQALVDRTVANWSWQNARILALLDSSRPYLPGAIGEVAKAYFWRKSDSDTSDLAPEGVVARMWLPVAPDLVAAAGDWLRDVPDLGTFQTLDLLVSEMDAGCRAAATNVGHARSAPRIYPLAHRRTIAAMMGLPPEYKRQKRFAGDLLRSRLPELGQLPFNEPIGILSRLKQLLRTREETAAR
jgi:hypothetical protein